MITFLLIRSIILYLMANILLRRKVVVTRRYMPMNAKKKNKFFSTSDLSIQAKNGAIWLPRIYSGAFETASAHWIQDIHLQDCKTEHLSLTLNLHLWKILALTYSGSQNAQILFKNCLKLGSFLSANNVCC